MRNTRAQNAISETEHRELLVLAMAGQSEAADDLLQRLERLRIVPDRKLPVDVVGLNTTVTYRPDSGGEREVTLVYPAQADISAGKISVLTPVGTALLGLRVGESMSWEARDGNERTLTVLTVRQPEFVA